MKSYMRASAILCATLCFTLGSPMSSARADDNEELVRSAQMRLASVGFYVGHYDGKMGPVTAAAIMDFQSKFGLPVSGRLTPETYSMLSRREFTVYPTHYTMYPYNHYRLASTNPVYVAPTAMNWDNRWAFNRMQSIPNRFAKLDVQEQTIGSLRHYAVTLNGHAVLFANNQPGVLRVSQAYQMNNEDALIITAYQGDGTCAYKNYLLTVHSNGTFNMPREIGNCSGSYEAHVANNTLLMSFTGANLMNGWKTWDVWRLEDNNLARI